MADNQEYFDQKREERKMKAKSSAINLNTEENKNLRMTEDDEWITYNKDRNKYVDNDGESVKLVDDAEQPENKSKQQVKSFMDQMGDVVDSSPDKFTEYTNKIDRRNKLLETKEKQYQKDLANLKTERMEAKDDIERDKIDKKIKKLQDKHSIEMVKIDKEIGDLTKKRANIKYLDFTSEQARISYEAEDKYYQAHQNANLPYNSFEGKTDREKKKDEEHNKKSQEKLNKNRENLSKKQKKQANLREKRMNRAQKTLNLFGVKDSSGLTNKLFTSSSGTGFKSKLANAGKGILKFIVCHPVIVIIIIIINLLVGFATRNNSGYNNPYSQISRDTIEYNAWTEVFNDGQIDFFNQYRTTVSGSNLASIIYIMKDDDKYQEVVQNWFEKLDKKDYYTEKGGECISWKYTWGGSTASTKAIATKECSKYSEDKELNDVEAAEAYLKAVYKGAVEEYTKELDLYELRELFLKEVKYDYSYLYREWTDWTTQSPPKRIDTKVSSLEAEQSALTTEAYQHNELVPMTATVEIIKYKIEYYYEMETVENSYDYCIKEGHKWSSNANSDYMKCRSGKHEENVRKEREVSYSEYATITYYKYRDVIEGTEEWVKDYSKAEKNANRDTLNTPETVNKNSLYGRTIEGSVSENGITKEWESRYYDNSGVITRRIRYWELYTFNETVDLLLDEYYPETENPKYKGNQITLTAKDDVYGTVYIQFDKTKIFKAYYSNNRLIIKENYFNSQNKPILKEGILGMRELLQVAFGYSGDFNPFPDFDNTEAWKHSSEGGTNNFEYGQCTWFVYGLVYQNYGAEAASYLNGNGNQMASVAISKSGNDYWTEGDISNGAIISFGVGSSGAGHVAMIWIDDEGKTMIAEGNLNGITDDWSSAILDYQITEQTPEQWSSWYGGSYQVAVPSGASGSTNK